MKLFGKFRFSLASLLLFVLLAAAVVGLKMSRAEVEQLREENAKFRRQLGSFAIEDVTKIYVLRQTSHENLEWRWRVYIPEGPEWLVRMESGEIPEAAFPKFEGGYNLQPLPSGEFTLVVRLYKNDGIRNGWHLKASWVENSATLAIDEKTSAWMDSSYISSGFGSDSAPVEFDPARDPQIELYRRQKVAETPDAGGSEPPRGFLIWLESRERFKANNQNW